MGDGRTEGALRGSFGVDVDIDLSRYAGKPMVLEFATATQFPSGERIEMAAFGEPHLVGPTHRSANRETPHLAIEN